MTGVERLPISDAELRKLPLAFRTLYFKPLPMISQQAELHHVRGQGARIATSLAYEKPISRA
jgi:hypothetical protein